MSHENATSELNMAAFFLLPKSRSGAAPGRPDLEHGYDDQGRAGAVRFTERQNRIPNLRESYALLAK